MGEKIMFCTKCGAQSSGNEKFCTKCGAPLETFSSNFSSAAPNTERTQFQNSMPNAWSGQPGNPGQAAYANPYMNAKPNP
ncbi:MAG TPA: zinc-ribbon domain-containing protein [Candidatus Fimenecus excrementavium]|nr:zinc-ribbon domain-containing protein [Candidatus Fimenecus excrementavium]